MSLLSQADVCEMVPSGHVIQRSTVQSEEVELGSEASGLAAWLHLLACCSVLMSEDVGSTSWGPPLLWSQLSLRHHDG